MPKYLTPVSRAKIRELHIEVASLQDKLAAQALQQEHELDVLQKQLTSKDAEIQQLKHLHAEELKKPLKSYLQPTKSTLLKQTPERRSSNLATSISIRDTQGKLIVDSSLNEASYMRPTKSTLSRAGKLPPPLTEDELYAQYWAARCPVDLTHDEPDCSDRSIEAENAVSPEKDALCADEYFEPTVYYHPNVGDRGNYRESCHCPFCEDFQSGRHIQVVADIQDRTRCHDKFFDKPSSRISIPFEHQLRLLRAAYSIAQKAFWHGLERYWPGQEMYNYPLGPDSVRFGFSELKEVLGSMHNFSWSLRSFLYPEVNGRWADLCTRVPTFVEPTIINMRGIRNVLAHPSNLLSDYVDSLLKDAHDLACMMRDEPRALEVRALRDELRDLATESFNEIERLEPWIHLPNDIVWPTHHEATFQQMLRSLQLGDDNPRYVMDNAHEKHYDPAIVRAARHWAEQSTIPGLSNWQRRNHWLSYKDQEHMSNWLRAQRRMEEKKSREGRWRSRVRLEIDVQKLCEKPLLM
ncbi:unnamed protein product [Cercospora beticola]|nr:unnamed protein product [Cercospora beticola]